MRTFLLAGALMMGAVAMGAAPASAGCNACNIQTKVPTANQPGMFTYHIVCIDDSSGDEVASNITAASDEAAMAAAAAKCN